MTSKEEPPAHHNSWIGKGLLRVVLLVVAAGLIAAFASAFGIAYDYGYLRTSILTGAPDGAYYALGSRLAARVQKGHGALTVIPTAGSVDNVARLTADPGRCDASFALMQDGTPVPGGSGVEVLGRLPEPETLILLARRGRKFDSFTDLRGATIGIGPEKSGTANLMRHLFSGDDLRALDIRFSQQPSDKQAELVAKGDLDLAAFVMRPDAKFLRDIVTRYDLDVVAPREMDGIIARHPWLDRGRIPTGFYDLAVPVPATDRVVAQVETLVVSGPCARRADRVGILMLLAAELPGFVRANPPKATGSATAIPLAPEARQFFLSGEPEIADRYFPWLVNLLSPAYWVYLLMAVTVLFNAMKAMSRYRLWRIDAARERIERRIAEIAKPDLGHADVRSLSPDTVSIAPDTHEKIEGIRNELAALRLRARNQAASMVTPMGEEMFYRYQEFRIDETLQAVAALAGGAAPTGTGR